MHVTFGDFSPNVRSIILPLDIYIYIYIYIYSIRHVYVRVFNRDINTNYVIILPKLCTVISNS